jgi:hypothetical protein
MACPSPPLEHQNPQPLFFPSSRSSIPSPRPRHCRRSTRPSPARGLSAPSLLRPGVPWRSARRRCPELRRGEPARAEFRRPSSSRRRSLCHRGAPSLRPSPAAALLLDGSGTSPRSRRCPPLSQGPPEPPGTTAGVEPRFRSLSPELRRPCSSPARVLHLNGGGASARVLRWPGHSPRWPEPLVVVAGASPSSVSAGEKRTVGEGGEWTREK